MDDGLTGFLTGFETAVRDALDELGAELLGRPHEFVCAVSDLYDSDSPELVVLYAHCGDELMRPYVEAARERTEAALGQAARRGERWLHDDRRVDPNDARAVAWGVARGVAAHLGVGLPKVPGCWAGVDDVTTAALERAHATLANPAATEADVAAALDALRALPLVTREAAELKLALEVRLKRIGVIRDDWGAGSAMKDARAVLARPDATEGELCSALAALRALPFVPQGAEALESALELRLARLARNWDARREDPAQRDPATETTSGFAPAPKPANGAVVAVVALVVCVLVAVALAMNSSQKDQEGDAMEPTPAVTVPTPWRLDGRVSGVGVRDELGEYSWDELKEISRAIAEANDDVVCLRIARRYNLVDEDGML